MAEVFLDAEKVDFQGGEPATASALWELLDGYLGQQGRVLDALRLDGDAWTLGSEDRAYGKAEATSISQGARIEALLNGVMQGGEPLTEEFRELSRKCLSQGIEQSKRQAMSVVESVKPFLEVMGLVEMYGKNSDRPWTPALSQSMAALNEAIGSWLDAVEAGKSVELSDRSALSVLPALESVILQSNESIVGQVEGGAS